MTTWCTRSVLRLLPAVLLLPAALSAQRPPTNVAAVESRGAVTISWTGVGAEVTYRVLRALDQRSRGEDLTRPLGPGATSFIDTRVVAGTTYFYQVVAVYGDGSQGASLLAQLVMPRPLAVIAPAPTPAPAPPSATVMPSRTTVSGLAPPAPVSPLPAPPAPTGVSVTGTPAQAVVTWRAMSGVASFTVTRRESNVPAQPATLPGSAVAWTDKGLRPASAYTYTVDAVYSDGRSASSSAPFTSPPAINPSGFSGTPTGAGAVKLSWQAVTGADYYVVLGPGSSNGGVKVIGTTTYNVTGAPVGLQTWAVGSYYDPGPIPAGALVGPYAVSTPATQFPRVPVQVAPAPLPPAASTARRTAFNPAVNGFMFVNDFKNSCMGPPINIETSGLCGGMSYAVLDYYLARKRLPAQAFRPANNTQLQQYLYQREATSLLQNLDRWAELGVNPLGSRNVEFFNWGLSGQLVALRSFIDRGVPVPLGLKAVGSLLESHDHQVLAIGYDVGRYAGDLGNYKTDVRIFILDPNLPGREVTLVPDLGTSEFYEKEYPVHRWRSYFVDGKYLPMTPPPAFNPVYPNDGLVHELRFEFSTGADDMRGGADHVDATIILANGTSQVYPNISQGGQWLPGYSETAQVILTQAVPQASIKRIEIVTDATGGLNGDNWDMKSVGVRAVGGGFDRNLLNSWPGPYRFTGARTPLVIPVP